MVLQAPARLISSIRQQLPSLGSNKTKAGWIFGGSMLTIKSSPDVALILLVALTYAMVQYVRLAHSVLQQTSAASFVKGIKSAATAMKEEDHPECKIKIERPICETKAEDLLIHCEDDVRHEKDCPTVAIKTGDQTPITPPKSPVVKQSESSEPDRSKETLSSTDCTDFVQE